MINSENKSSTVSREKEKYKIVVISASGIGNTILFTPTLSELKKKLPSSRIDLVVYKKEFGACVQGSGLVDEIFTIPKNPLNVIGFIISLRKRKYYVSITAFPSNKWQFNVFSFLLGAKKRITHSYEVGKLRSLSFLQNLKVPSDPSLHDVYQNLNLLKPLRFNVNGIKPELIFHLSDENRLFADSFLQDYGINNTDYVVGVHAGAGPLGGRKKWGLEKFAGEINRIIEKNSENFIFLFGGSEEAEERGQLRKLICSDRVKVVEGTLAQTAALISKCSYFISNDTGLMHIAAAFGIKQKAVFISTNVTRTRPFNVNAEVIQEGENMSYKYPFKSTRA